MTQQGLIVDLFAGPGGWSEGLRVLGLHDVGIEWDEAACRTRAAAGHLTIRADVSQYPTEPLVGMVWGLIASPPCQAWSMAGKRLGELDRANCHQLAHRMAAGDDSTDWTTWADERSPLVAQPVRWVRDIRPEWVALEQVPAVLGLWRSIGRILRGWGYSVWTGVLNAANFGVPQSRQRAFLTASLVGSVTAPEPTHCRGGSAPTLLDAGRESWVSMADALGWGATDRPVPTVTAGGTRTGGAEPLARGGREALCRMTCSCGGGCVVWRNGNQENSAERPSCQPAPTVHFGHGSSDVRWVVDRRTNSKAAGHRNGAPMVPTAPVPITEPAPTLTSKAGGQWVIRPDLTDERPSTTVCADPRIGRPGHKDREDGESAFEQASVRVTVTEAAILQSFPADYPWQGSRTKQFEQVGNAVPPKLVVHVLAPIVGIKVSGADA